MDSDERDVFEFLKTRGDEFASYKEIARRAGGKKKYYQDPEWAKPILTRMQERGILESDMSGRFRIKPVGRKNKNSRWVSPDIAKILQQSGVKIEGGEDIGTDDFYDKM
jgi:hypothetical protein